MEKDGAAVDDLASVLFALQDDRLTTGMVTARITQAIVSWALARGWLPRPEARVAFSGASETGFRSG